uniref:Uncharacterized protein n=1 Tax=Populus alba TaxID=43335 RepID=A0A4U5QSF4_POPAL|nr:hypothetical protein D5086_0000048490 [Populus alba]
MAQQGEALSDKEFEEWIGSIPVEELTLRHSSPEELLLNEFQTAPRTERAHQDCEGRTSDISSLFMEDNVRRGRPKRVGSEGGEIEHEDVNHYESKAPHPKMAHPWPDHFYPLHVAMGAAGDDAEAELVHRSWTKGTEKTRILEEEEGGVVFFAPSLFRLLLFLQVWICKYWESKAEIDF